MYVVIIYFTLQMGTIIAIRSSQIVSLEATNLMSFCFILVFATELEYLVLK